MRVLWFTNSPCNYNKGKAHGYNGGGWMSALQEELQKRKDIELGICFVRDGEPEKSIRDGVAYYPVPRHTVSIMHKIGAAIHPADVKYDERLWQHYLSHFKEVAEDFKPDVIEVFGSELYTGLATMLDGYPKALHLQGLLSLSIYIYYPCGFSSHTDIFRDWNIKRIYERKQGVAYWHRSCHREQQLFRHANHVIGRTAWDKAGAAILNPNARYHYGGEILRSVFYENHERVIPKKLTIVTTSSGAMYKGFDFVLKVADIIKNKTGIDFEWRVFGNINPRFFEKVTGIRHQDVNVRICGVASAEQLCDEICHATVYFQPSYIENSPNSVCESQLLGVTPIATNVGGTSSLIEEGKDGLLVPAGEPYYAAHQIISMYQDKARNLQIGNAARETARKRHDREKIVSELVDTYKEVINSWTSRTSDGL